MQLSIWSGKFRTRVYYMSYWNKYYFRNSFYHFCLYRVDTTALFYDNSLATVFHGPLPRYVKLRVAHAPGMPGTFSPQLRVSDPDMHHGTCVTHVSWCMPGSLSSGFLSSRWWGKRSRHSRRMRNPQFHVSGKRPMKRLKDSMINTFPGTKSN